MGLGQKEYFLTDYNQTNAKCPECGEQKVFVRSFVYVLQFYHTPILPRHKHAHARCRACNTNISHGDDSKIDLIIDQTLENTDVSKWLYVGAFMYPLSIISIVMMILFAS